MCGRNSAYLTGVLRALRKSHVQFTWNARGAQKVHFSSLTANPPVRGPGLSGVHPWLVLHVTQVCGTAAQPCAGWGVFSLPILPMCRSQGSKFGGVKELKKCSMIPLVKTENV